MQERETSKPKSARLIQVAELFLGVNPTREARGGGEQVSMVQVSDLDSDLGQVLPEGPLKQGFVQSRGALNRVKLREGDLLVSCKGTIGKVGLVSSEFVGSVPTSNLIVVRPGDQILPTTLLAVFRTKRIQEFIRTRSKGAAISTLSYKDLETLEIPIPDLVIQQGIKDLLQAHSDFVAVTREAIKDRQSLVDEMMENAIWR